MDRTVFKTLAEGYIKQHAYEVDLQDAISKVTSKHNGVIDFLGFPYDSFTIMSAVLNGIGVFDTYGTFDYFVHDCDGDWVKFNEAIEWEEGGETKHPDCHNLDDLYDYILLENSGKKSAQEK